MAESPDAPSFPYAEFTHVKSKKSRKNRKIKSRASALLSLQRNREELRKESAIGFPVGSSDSAGGGAGSKDASTGTWFSQCSRVLSRLWNDDRSPSDAEVLCLGLGSPSDSPNANVQLAFMLDICESLKLGPDRISVYDPVFAEEDLVLFKELGIQVLTENKKGGHPLAVPTLCFMLHCDMELYEAILKANWSKERLRNFILIGNSLTDYLDSKPRRTLETAAPHLLRIAPHLESRPLSPSKQWPTAFNNTCLQFFPSHEDAPDIFSNGESQGLFVSPEDGVESTGSETRGKRLS